MADHGIPLAEFDAEMAITRRLLERVPDDKSRWKPHEKSFPLGHLAELLSIMPGWITQTLTHTELSLGDFAGYSSQPTASLLKVFDDNVSAARRAIETVTGDG